jgi:hypothetical protein
MKGHRFGLNGASRICVLLLAEALPKRCFSWEALRKSATRVIVE